ncbi:MAG: FmdE family protein [Candidatus Hydrothermarchaeota archaeon]
MNFKDFHGHICPMSILGIKMSNYALKLLDINSKKEGIIAIPEIRNCMVDGIQWTIGATFGKTNLIFRDIGKYACVFSREKDGRSLRIKIKDDIVEKSLEYGKEAQMVRKRLSKMDEEEKRWELELLFRKGRNIVDYIEKKDYEDLFEVNDVELNLKIEEDSLDVKRCDKCGEITLKEKLTDNLCKDCLDPFYSIKTIP